MYKNKYPSPESPFLPGDAPNLTRHMSKSRGRFVSVQNILETTRAIVGPDVSHWNGQVDWNKMVSSQTNMGFAMCKATQGTSDIDTQFIYNITHMQNAFSAPNASRTFGGYTHKKIAFGVYHYANIIPTYTDSDYQTQADFFYNTVANSVNNNVDYFPNFWVLDWEDTNGNSIPQITRANYAKVFVQQLYNNLMNKFGHLYVPKIFIYVEPYNWGDISIDTDWFTTYGPKLWVASYFTANVLPETDTNNKYNIADKYTNNTSLNFVNSLGNWIVWQYTPSVSFPGISSPCDVNVARTSEDWNLNFYQTSSL